VLGSRWIQIRIGTWSRERVSQKTRRDNLLYNITAQATDSDYHLSSPVYVLTHALQHKRSEILEADDIHTPDRACPTILIKQRAPDLTLDLTRAPAIGHRLSPFRCALDREHTQPRQHEVAYVRNATRLGTLTAISRGGVYMSSLEATDSKLNARQS
jgi:hypothetical protein